MITLTDIFVPIADGEIKFLDKVKVVTFNTVGTLVHKVTNTHYAPNMPIIKLFQFLSTSKDTLGLEHVLVLSGGIQHARHCLKSAGLDGLAAGPIHDKVSYLTDPDFRSDKTLMIDYEAAIRAATDISVDPNLAYVRLFLHKHMDAFQDLIAPK